MKQGNWKYWISPALLALVLLAGLWYYRPVDIYTLAPALEPAGISVVINRFSEDEAMGHGFRNFDVDAASPQGLALLERLEALRIRRPPTNLLLQILTPTTSGRQVQDGDYNYVIHIFGQDGGWVALQFFIDAWEYDTPRQSQYLSCRVSGGADSGRALGDYLWELSQEFESDS